MPDRSAASSSVPTSPIDALTSEGQGRTENDGRQGETARWNAFSDDVLDGPTHTFLETIYGMGMPGGRCGFCSRGTRDEHGAPHPAVVAGGEALRQMAPGWYKDGGGIHAVQDSEMAAAAVLRSAIEGGHIGGHTEASS